VERHSDRVPPRGVHGEVHAAESGKPERKGLGGGCFGGERTVREPIEERGTV